MEAQRGRNSGDIPPPATIFRGVFFQAETGGNGKDPRRNWRRWQTGGKNIVPGRLNTGTGFPEPWGNNATASEATGRWSSGLAAGGPFGEIAGFI
jgi:hypothetical protein